MSISTHFWSCWSSRCKRQRLRLCHPANLLEPYAHAHMVGSKLFLFSRIFLAYKSKVIHMLIPGKRLTSSPYIWPLTIQSWKVRHLCNIMPPGLMAEIPAVTSQASISFPKEGGATWNKKAKCSIRRFEDFNGPYMSLCIVFEYCTSIYFQTDHNFFGA